MTAANLIRLATIAALMTGLRSQQAAQLHSEDCAGCHDSGYNKGEPYTVSGEPAGRFFGQIEGIYTYAGDVRAERRVNRVPVDREVSKLLPGHKTGA
jgi:hypothetical protein